MARSDRRKRWWRLSSLFCSECSEQKATDAQQSCADSASRSSDQHALRIRGGNLLCRHVAAVRDQHEAHDRPALLFAERRTAALRELWRDGGSLHATAVLPEIVVQIERRHELRARGHARHAIFILALHLV